MSIHIASINSLHMLPTDYAQAKAREGIIRQMAMHLVAGATGALDLSSDFDVIRYLRETPQQYPVKIITAHMDAAIHLARETIAAASMGLR